jgi:hypothetical protein
MGIELRCREDYEVLIQNMNSHHILIPNCRRMIMCLGTWYRMNFRFEV